MTEVLQNSKKVKNSYQTYIIKEGSIINIEPPMTKHKKLRSNTLL